MSASDRRVLIGSRRVAFDPSAMCAAQRPTICGQQVSPSLSAGISLPRDDHRLGEPSRAGVAAVEHDGCHVLSQGAGEGARAVRHARDFQHRPGQRGEFTGILAVTGVRISMAGRGRRIDNVFIEQLWRSLKYEDIQTVWDDLTEEAGL
jgi:hypothetical protein